MFCLYLLNIFIYNNNVDWLECWYLLNIFIYNNNADVDAQLQRSARIGCCCLNVFSISLRSSQFHSNHCNVTLIIAIPLSSSKYHSNHRNVTLVIAISLWSSQYHSDHRNITFRVKYFFAKWDLDLSIDLFSYLFCIFQIILLPNIMFYPIITTLDGGGGAGQK